MQTPKHRILSGKQFCPTVEIFPMKCLCVYAEISILKLPGSLKASKGNRASAAGWVLHADPVASQSHKIAVLFLMSVPDLLREKLSRPKGNRDVTTEEPWCSHKTGIVPQLTLFLGLNSVSWSCGSCSQAWDTYQWIQGLQHLSNAMAVQRKSWS